MFKKFIEKIIDALKKMTGVKEVVGALETYDIVSLKMKEAIDRWNAIYQDKSPWLSKNVKSLQLGKTICQTLTMMVLSEMELNINAPNSEDGNERSKYLEEQIRKHFLPHLSDNVEYGMALGSLLLKPYKVDDQILFDFVKQGDYIPLAYDDDGNLIDVAFTDQFTVGEKTYTRIERQTFLGNRVVIQNKAFVSKNKNSDLGQEIPLSAFPRWASLEEEVTINNVTRSLFGQYKVPLANNIDYESPLGISVFSPAEKLMEMADRQFSRLDWEYEGGQLAVDVNDTALIHSKSYRGNEEIDTLRMGQNAERLYRGLDIENENLYQVFNPSLRDSAFQSGLEKYLMRIEDTIGLARGSISEVTSEARTATEIKILKQRTYITIKAHQMALQKAIEDCVYAMDVLASLYDITTEGDYDLAIDWKDSVLTDTQEQLNQRLELVSQGILSKAEVRAWWTGESIEDAQTKIDEIGDGLDDIFTRDLNIGDE